MKIKIASEEEEFEQIHQLNYKTFVEEIPQHELRSDKKLVDKFHDINTYLIAKENNRVFGTISFNSTRPFSLDSKLDFLDKYIPDNRKPVEIRLFAVEKSFRNGVVAYRLIENIIDLLYEEGFDIALISGTTRQLPLYKKIGFISFGPLVGKNDALYQPMYITLNKLKNDLRNGKF